MFLKTRIGRICGILNLGNSHNLTSLTNQGSYEFPVDYRNLTSLTNQGSYEFPADYRSIVCGGKREMVVKRIQDRCLVKRWIICGAW
jgi:hypothetical protein